MYHPFSTVNRCLFLLRVVADAKVYPSIHWHAKMQCMLCACIWTVGVTWITLKNPRGELHKEAPDETSFDSCFNLSV